MERTGLNNLLIIFIEHKTARKINYQDITNNFAGKMARKISF